MIVTLMPLISNCKAVSILWDFGPGQRRWGVYAISNTAYFGA